MAALNEIWTIGHSTRSFEELVALLQSFRIELLTDVRHFPGSRKFPHFNKSSLSTTLPETGIEYWHVEELGGRRQPKPDSKNINWRHPAFRGYADYMETDAFKTAFGKVENIARGKRTALMCSEAVWWRCHRAMIADLLKARGWNVQHIMAIDKSNEHHFTGPARVVDKKLYYH